ncbi:unnamed protein product [Gongylonema pulchrum]|uniref:Uncharacterized protein n=1 Tax=Gongylonema pulchrum TaxID=637853 RepID=A0A3P7M997_9BILA|nr:unnamed protein product [Gongylonema pulchrum]
MHEETLTMAIGDDATYSLEFADGVPRYLISEVGSNGTIIGLTEKYAILYTDCSAACLLPSERRVSVWTKFGSDPDTKDLGAVLYQACILEEELDKRTGSSECW